MEPLSTYRVVFTAALGRFPEPLLRELTEMPWVRCESEDQRSPVITPARIKGCHTLAQGSEIVNAATFLEGATVRVAVVHGLANARRLIDQMASGETEYRFVEVMACPGGCIGGAGQPRLTTDEIREKRIAAIYREDEGKSMRKSHDNPKIKQIYGEFLKFPLGKRSHQLLHRGYVKRGRV